MLIAPYSETGDDESIVREPKITTYSQVRDLRDILANPDSKAVLLDPAKSLGDALGVAKADELSSSWRSEISEAASALGKIGAFDLEALGQEDLASLQNLGETISKVLATHAKLTA